MRNLCIILLLSPLLSGCLAFAAALNQADETWQYAKLRMENIVNGPSEEAPQVVYLPATSYCYRTLGHVDCYATPQNGHETRLVGYQDAARGPNGLQEIIRESQIKRDQSEEEARKRRQLAAERRARKAREEMIAAAPMPVEKPVKQEEDIEDPLELIRFRLGDKEYTLKEPPTEEELAF